MSPATPPAVVVASTEAMNRPGIHASIDFGKESFYAHDQDDRNRQEGAPMPKEPKEPKQPPEIQSLADGESSVLGAFARIEADILDMHKSEPYWAERISKLKEGLTTTFAKQIAAYLLRDEEFSDDPTPLEQSAWKLAQKMMIQVQPGYRQKIRAEEMAATKSK